MNIEVKKISISDSLSEETLAYTANVYIDGKLSGAARNSGNGGATDISPFDVEGAQRIRAAEKWVASQPEVIVKSKSPDTADFVYKQDLADYVDSIVFAYDDKRNMEKHNRKAEKAMKDGIIFGLPDKEFAGNKFSSSIEDILKQPNGQDVLLKSINKNILPHLRDGDLILNTNLPKELMDKVGLQHFHIPSAKQEQKPATKPAPKQKRQGPRR